MFINWVDESEDPDEYEDLILMVYTQLIDDITKRDVQPVLDWLQTLDEDTLLQFLPKDNPMFHGTRPDRGWFGAVEYLINTNTVLETIGRN